MANDLSPIAKAQELLDMDPLPDDAKDQLDAIYEQANELDQILIGDLYEALFVLTN